MICTCGEPESHVIAKRRTADNIAVLLWSDGAVTGRFGDLPDVTRVRPRTREATNAALRAGWLLMGEVEIHNLSEVPALYGACRWTAERDGLPGTVRARLTEMRRPSLTPVWTVEMTDRDGKPTSRYWRLPRLVSPGTVLWDHVSVGAAGGRYEIHRIIPGTHGETCMPSGILFSTIRDAISFILAERDSTS